MPGDNLNEFQDILTEISAICQRYDTQYIIMGDNFNINHSPQTNDLSQYSTQECFRNVVKYIVYCT